MTRSVRDPQRPYTITDLCEATGWSRPTVTAAVRGGFLPGYQSGPGGKWWVPPDAFHDLLKGRWKPNPKPVEIRNMTAFPEVSKRVAS